MPAKKRCLILAAGFGTRMGSIGTHLPKVMWPVFGQSLLELQLRFARKLGYSEVWINLHHQADIILEKTKNNPVFAEVRWLRERPEILDIGGGIHNLASQPDVNYQGELLVLNADQFLWFTSEELERWKIQAGAWDVLLLNWMVNSSQGYNQVVSNEAREFQGVVKNAELPRDLRMETYSGNSIVRLEGLRPQQGPSAFFESVCAPTQHKCKTALLRDGRYWDFGTAPRYWNSMQEIMKAKAQYREDAFTLFLEETHAFDKNEFHGEQLAYHCDVPGLIHLGVGVPQKNHAPGVILEGQPSNEKGASPVLVYNGNTQLLS